MSRYRLRLLTQGWTLTLPTLLIEPKRISVITTLLSLLISRTRFLQPASLSHISYLHRSDSQTWHRIASAIKRSPRNLLLPDGPFPVLCALLISFWRKMWPHGSSRRVETSSPSVYGAMKRGTGLLLVCSLSVRIFGREVMEFMRDARGFFEGMGGLQGV